MTKDLVLKNAQIITIDPANPQATCCIIRENKILWVGGDKETENCEILDLQGSYLYPGFIDSHAHIYHTGHTANHQINLHGLKSKEAVLEKVRAEANAAVAGDWIIGYGWDEHHWRDSAMPHYKDLDAISRTNPILLRRVDSHAIWVNSAILELVGSHPTGILIDDAASLVHPFIPKPTVDETKALTKLVLNECLKVGITSIHNAALYEKDFEAYNSLARANELAVRIYAMAALPTDTGEALFLQGPQHFGPFLEVRCIKFFLDGSLGSRGALLFSPYNDAPETSGHLLWQEGELLEKLLQAKAKGFQVAIHAIGDRANHLVLNAYEKVGVTDLRWRIEHAQILDPKDIKRFSQLGVIAAMQPLHLIEDMPWMENRLGIERANSRAFLWRSLLNEGTIIAGGSDAPVVNINPLLGIWAAITREGFYPQECVSREEALKMYTLHAAYSQFRENELGSITVGKLADLVVLPENLLTCHPKALLDMQVLYTIVNGKVAYDSAKA